MSLLIFTQICYPSFVAVASVFDFSQETPVFEEVAEEGPVFEEPALESEEPVFEAEPEAEEVESEPSQEVEISQGLVEAKELEGPLKEKVKVAAEAEPVFGEDDAVAVVEEAGERKPVVREAEGHKIERLELRWVTTDTFPDNDDKLLSQKWTGNDGKVVQARWTYELSGQHDYEPGTIRFKIPKYIFKDRNGRPHGRMTLAVPEAPDRSGQFAYTDMGDYYLLANTKRLSAATNGYIEASFRDLIPSEIKDYATGYQTDAMNVELEVDLPKGAVMRQYSEDIRAQVDTREWIKAVRKVKDTARENFPSSWPENLKPDNPDDYYYASWRVSASVEGNQPFKLRIKDAVSNGKVLGYRDARSGKWHEPNASGELDDQIFEGYVPDGGGRYQFNGTVYTAYSKESLEGSSEEGLDNWGRTVYTLRNTVNYYLEALDDKEQTEGSDSDSQKLVIVKFLTPNGHFWVT